MIPFRVPALLLVCAAGADQPSPPETLFVPAMPPHRPTGAVSVGIGVALPKGGDSSQLWTSSDPRITCDGTQGLLNVHFKVDSSEHWPYVLPTSAVCSQGAVRAEIPLAFGPPDAEYWFSDDGTLVVPRPAPRRLSQSE